MEIGIYTRQAGATHVNKSTLLTKTWAINFSTSSLSWHLNLVHWLRSAPIYKGFTSLVGYALSSPFLGLSLASSLGFFTREVYATYCIFGSTTLFPLAILKLFV